MTIVQPLDAGRSFGSGGAEPYATALQASDPERLHLIDIDTGRSAPFEVVRWCEPADGADLTMLLGVDGPVLDVGCGPGRMVRAALDFGLPTLGVDVSSAAVRLARAAGLPVLERSVFDTLPHSEWSTILLADGNIGIGGNPVALLTRCRDLLAEGGTVVVEVSPEESADRRYRARVNDDAGRSSDEFLWAEVGGPALARDADLVGLSVRQSWTAGARSFSRLAVTSR